MRDHGGDIDAAIKSYGGRQQDWLDLSTGINRLPYQVPALHPEDWTTLPPASEMSALQDAARHAFKTAAPVVALAGAQMAIQIVPLLASPALARVLSPTYNEHAAALRALGWTVEEVADLSSLAGADIAVVVNPNNPDGRRHMPEDLLSLTKRVGRLVVDESFTDPEPELSLAPYAGRPGLIVLRSFGKFYGLAGVRLGFAIASVADAERIAALSGPWPVSGAAIRIGKVALRDDEWRRVTSARLERDARRLDNVARAAGWRIIGGTHLFRLCDAGNAEAAKDVLARKWIWSRIFPWSQTWLRLGLPGPDAEWERLQSALCR